MAEYRLLNQFYEKDHRARLIKHDQVLPILRPRTHDWSQVMVYDHRYTPLLQRAGLHVIANLVRGGMPTFNPTALTALIDRWRPETTLDLADNRNNFVIGLIRCAKEK
jgi:hypothetical protein